MTKEELLNEVRVLLSDLLEQIDYACTGMESSDDTIMYCKDVCECSYHRIFGASYQYENGEDEEE